MQWPGVPRTADTKREQHRAYVDLQLTARKGKDQACILEGA